MFIFQPVAKSYQASSSTAFILDATDAGAAFSWGPGTFTLLGFNGYAPGYSACANVGSVIYGLNTYSMGSRFFWSFNGVTKTNFGTTATGTFAWKYAGSNIGSVFWLFGGSDGPGFSNQISSFSGSSYSVSGQTLASAKRSVSSTTLSSIAYIFGGRTSNSPLTMTNQIDSFNGTTRSAAAVTMPSAVSETAAAVLSGVAYVFGGYTSAPASVTSIRSFNGSTISTIGATISGCDGYAVGAGSVGNAIGTFGGLIGVGGSNVTQIFDGTTVTQDIPMPQTAVDISAVAALPIPAYAFS